MAGHKPKNRWSFLSWTQPSSQQNFQSSMTGIWCLLFQHWNDALNYWAYIWMPAMFRDILNAVKKYERHKKCLFQEWYASLLSRTNQYAWNGIRMLQMSPINSSHIAKLHCFALSSFSSTPQLWKWKRADYPIGNHVQYAAETLNCRSWRHW